MSDVYLIKYSGIVGTYMTTQQAYLGYGLATSALPNDKPAIAFSSKAECLFFIQSHIYHADFGHNGMIPWLVPKVSEYTYEMYKPKEVSI
jgi:hypothetical protein